MTGSVSAAEYATCEKFHMKEHRFHTLCFPISNRD